MFACGGLAWAEAQLNAGGFVMARAAPGKTPDLSGLSCNFAAIEAERGVILSIIAAPIDDGLRFAALVADILGLLEAEGHASRPFSEASPLPARTGGEFEEAIAARDACPCLLTLALSVPRAVVQGIAHLVGLPMGSFHPARYRRQLVNNTDFRKFDDGLRMTVNCTSEIANTIEAHIKAAAQAGICRFGLHRQKTANLTCIVPPFAQANNVHFVDGASGGYAAAAARLKRGEN
jgi:hypothetical protein